MRDNSNNGIQGVPFAKNNISRVDHRPFEQTPTRKTTSDAVIIKKGPLVNFDSIPIEKKDSMSEKNDIEANNEDLKHNANFHRKESNPISYSSSMSDGGMNLNLVQLQK